MEILDGETGLPDPTPRQKPADSPGASEIPLSSPVDVRREQAKVYREARGGKLDKAEAAKLIWMLGEVRKSIELEEIERRLASLETRGALPAPTQRD